MTFDLNADGILSVSAKDKATGREQKITIQPSSGLSKEEIERMVRDAEAHAEEDRRRREEIETRNQADSLAYQAEKMLREQSDRVPSDLKLEVEGKIAAVRSALQSGDAATIRSAADDLSLALQRVGQAVYSQQAAGPDGAATDAGPGPRPADDGTVEGEFREV